VLKENAPAINKAMEKYVPRKYDAASLEFTCGRPSYAPDAESATKALSEPIWDLLDRGGKRWRPALFLLTVEALGKDSKEFVDFAAALEILHNGSLIVDDCEDSSELRRGKPCTYKTYGIDVAINAGNAMYFLPFLAFFKNKVDEKTRAAAYELMLQEMLNLHFGQGWDIWWHKGGKKDVSEKEYLQMCAYKTGTLARMAAKLAALLAGADGKKIDALGKFAEAIGVAFQIQDDLLNISESELAKGKGLGEDVHEGKRTLMVIHALAHSSKKDAERLRAILASHPSDRRTIDEAIAIMKAAGSLDYAKAFSKTLVKEAWDGVDSLLPASDAKEKLRAFADYLVERRV
ncbi:MAG: polyprenyl synthetase family protein, partial [Candidatus Micrarchaeota archaeon]